jgi:hypothetical protein
MKPDVGSFYWVRIVNHSQDIRAKYLGAGMWLPDGAAAPMAEAQLVSIGAPAPLNTLGYFPFSNRGGVETLS